MPTSSRLLLLLLLLSGGGLTNACAGDEPRRDQGANTQASRLKPTFAGGFSWPLLLSFSAGGTYSLTPSMSNSVFADTLSLRTDLELGAGGGYLGGGFTLPFAQGSFALNLKAARLRTWLLDTGPRPWRNYDGVIAELVLFGHVPGKLGIGYFRPSGQWNKRRERFWYLYLGSGW